MKAQGKLLVRIVTMALAMVDNRAEFERSMERLAADHYEKGIKAVEYGIMGETLFWALRRALGPTVYDTATHSVWVRIYSEMLTIIVPKVIDFELSNGYVEADRQCTTMDNVSTERASNSAPSFSDNTFSTDAPRGHMSLRVYARIESAMPTDAEL